MNSINRIVASVSDVFCAMSCVDLAFPQMARFGLDAAKL
jgi:hypothetical protein